MASLSLATPIKDSSHPTAASEQSSLLVVSFGDALATEYAARSTNFRTQQLDLCHPATLEEGNLASISACVLFARPTLTQQDQQRIVALVRRLPSMKFVGIVSSFRAHLEDSVARSETWLSNRLKASAARLVVFRPGHVVGVPTGLDRSLRKYGFAYPLVPTRIRTCFVKADEMFDAIERETRMGTRSHIVTLLGPSQSVRDMMRENGSTGPWRVTLTWLGWLLAFLLLGQLVSFLLFRLRPSMRCWHFETLHPRSCAELLALCNSYNMRYVKVVGYNNGVVHFGHRYPGRTVISTVLCNRIKRVGSDIIKVDCGTTIRQAADFLARQEQELHVLPNYSYVCLGTAFFIPIHGSASDYTTVAETFTKVLLFDPNRNRFLLANRDEPTFRDAVYNVASPLVILRLWMRVRAKATYHVRQQNSSNVGSDFILAALRDRDASNVEIRKANAANAEVAISKYYQTTSPGSMEVPRDRLGQLWDGLEENRLTSFLMHAFARHIIWHVELFLNADEFARFWRTHQTLPIKKIQLRCIHRDGLPHSPFRDDDCVSVDLFMFRWNRTVFEIYLAQNFKAVRFNPGKHSQ